MSLCGKTLKANGVLCCLPRGLSCVMASSGFNHSVKVPQLYKSASKIVKTVFEEGGSIKQLLYAKVRANLKGTYALITKTIEYNETLNKVLEETRILKDNKQLNVWLAKVLVTELMLGKGILGGKSKPVETILQYKVTLEEAFKKHDKNEKRQPPALKPRYVRVNTLYMTTDEVIKYFRQDGWFLVPLPTTYEEFRFLISRLPEEQFVRDFHVKDLLVFSAGTEFFRHPLYLDGTIILQDKASCMPPMLLEPEPGSIVLDMCSAPGMKTSMLSTLTRGKGTIYAIEMNDNRCKDLQKFVENTGCSNVTVLLQDALKLSVQSEPWCENVEYILVDPTCSGTGMTDRAHLFTRPVTEVELRRLAGFQRKLLLHALINFPSARRVVYSTCSMQKEENDDVVQYVLDRVGNSWELENALPEWPSRGDDSYSNGNLCLTSSPTKDFTTGFFMAIFRKSSSPEDKSAKSKKQQLGIPTVVDDPMEPVKTKRKRSKQCPVIEQQYDRSRQEVDECIGEETTKQKTVKKRKKDRNKF